MNRIALLFVAIVLAGCQTEPVPARRAAGIGAGAETDQVAADETAADPETPPETVDGEELPEPSQREKNSALIEAVTNNEMETVIALLSAGADPESRGLDGWAALAIAASVGSADAVEALLEAGASPRTQSPEGIAPIALASYNGHSGVVKLLLDAGVDPDQMDDDGWVPLAAAAASGRIKIVHMLLRHGIAIDAGSSTGRSALMMSSAFGHEQIVRTLLESGADPDAQSDDGATALGYAYTTDEYEIAEILIAASGDSQLQRGESHQQIYHNVTKDLVFSPGPHPGHLPEGQTMFYGEYTCAQGLAGSVVVFNLSGGDLTVINLHGPPVSAENLQPVGYFRTVGTCNPHSNRFTAVPDEWIVLQAPGWIMGGRDGVYDPATGRLEGRSILASTWVDGSSICTTFSHGQIEVLESGRALLDHHPKAPSTLVGIPRSLPLAETRWTGRFECDETGYRVEMTLEHHHGGMITGAFAFHREADDRAEAAFRLVGTHNPDTGRLTLGPTGWVGVTPPPGYHQMYYVDGHYHEPPVGLVVRFITGSGSCSDGALVTLMRVE